MIHGDPEQRLSSLVKIGSRLCEQQKPEEAFLSLHSGLKSPPTYNADCARIFDLLGALGLMHEQMLGDRMLPGIWMQYSSDAHSRQTLAERYVLCQRTRLS